MVVIKEDEFQKEQHATKNLIGLRIYVPPKRQPAFRIKELPRLI